MEKIIECVPNFSEGRNMDIINKITDEIKSVEGAVLLDVDPGKDTNRTVVTFVGTPDIVVEAAFRAVKRASELIDMSTHKGSHPRMGATDVCPLIPVSGITKEECVKYAQKLAERIGTLGIPVYLYAHAAVRPERKKLPDIRKGEYEALSEKMKDPDFAPDAGSAEFNSKSGATAVGVRDFMLAYNINLNTKEKKFARKIGMNIREKGRAKRDKRGKIIRDENGKSIIIPGKLKYCQAAGWYIEEYGYAQVTMNLHNYSVTGLHTAFDTVCEEAAKFGLRVTGSELVGLLPKKALLDAGKHYLSKQGRNTGIPEKEIIHMGIISLGLNDTTPFDPEKRIIEYCIENKEGKLISLRIEEFVDELSSNSPAPGGGSVSALSGALSSGLSSMAAALTFGKEGYKRYNGMMEDLSVAAQNFKRKFLTLVDEDTEVFNSYMVAVCLPKKTDKDKEKREEAIEAAAKKAAEIPFQTLMLCDPLMDLSDKAAKNGNKNTLSDVAVCAIQAEAAAEGAWMNVIINLLSIKDEKFRNRIREESDRILKSVKHKRKRIVNFIKKKLLNG